MQTERNHLAQTSIDAAADAELIEEPNRKFPLESAGATTKGRARSAAPLTRTEAKLHPTDFLAPLEIKLANSGEISGYGSTFGNVDLGGDIVAPSAFAKSLAEHAAEKTKPAMLWQHDLREPIGVWTDAREDGKGLLLNGKLTLDTRRGAEARALAKDGALALSIGYQTIDADFANGNRIIKEARLFEVSLVSIPMNPQAQLTSVKSVEAAAAEIRTAIMFERLLRASGFANSLARKLAAGWDAAVGRKDADDAGAIVEAITSSAARFGNPAPKSKAPVLDPSDPHFEFWRDYYAAKRVPFEVREGKDFRQCLTN